MKYSLFAFALASTVAIMNAHMLSAQEMMKSNDGIGESVEGNSDQDAKNKAVNFRNRLSKIEGEFTKADEMASQSALNELNALVGEGYPGAIAFAAGSLRRGEGQPKDPEAAFDLYNALAEAGNPFGWVGMGEMLGSGELGTPNPEDAFSNYAKAAAAGSTGGIIKKAEALSRGLGVTKDIDAALGLLQPLAEDGNAGAQLRIGDIFEKEGNFSEAARYYRLAADSGNENALLPLGRLLRDQLDDGLGAKNAFEEARLKGKSFASVELAKGYREGSFGAPDSEKSLTFMIEALDSGIPSAAIDLAKTLEADHDAHIDASKVISALDELRTQGNLGAAIEIRQLDSIGVSVPNEIIVQANTLIATLAEEGNGTALVAEAEAEQGGIGRPQDAQKALSMYQSAFDAGETWSWALISKMMNDPTSPTYDLSGRIEFLKKATEQGIEGAKRQYASALLTGAGTSTDPKAAIDLLDDLAKSGDPVANMMLGYVYSSGQGGSADIDAARVHFAAAAEKGVPNAWFALGELEREHGNGVAALDAFGKGAEAGNERASLRYALLLRDGLGNLQPNPKLAFEKLTALADSDAEARVNLAVGHMLKSFSAESSEAEGRNLIASMLEEKDTPALSSLVLQLYHDEIREAVDVTKMADILYFAGQDGDSPSAAAFVRLARRFPSDVSNARARVDTISHIEGLVPERVKMIDGLAFDASQAQSLAAWREVGEKAAQATPNLRPAMLQSLRGANPNAYVYSLQLILRPIVAPNLKANGLLDVSTIRAVSAYCKLKGISSECIQGPLHWDTVRSMSAALSQ